jgi:uncharacterized membrane protein YoaK (UPF0700 family)
MTLDSKVPRASAGPLSRRSLKLRPLATHMARSTRKVLRTFGENLELGTLLAFVAGVVNTVGFLQFGTFVSHISGHATRTAVEYTEGNSDAAWVFFLEMISFVFGAFFTSFLLKGHTAAYAKIKYTAPVLIEAGILLFFLFLNSMQGLLWFHIGTISLTTTMLAFAMGMQNAMLRQAAGTLIRTTHMTGVATDIGIEMGAATSFMVQAIRRHRGWERWRAGWKAFWERLGIGRFTFHILLLLCFFLGSAFGTMGYVYINSFILLVPALILSLVGLKEYLRRLPEDHHRSS